MLIAIAWLALGGTLRGDVPETLIFQDDFERSESQEVQEEIGPGWSTNSAGRAGGHKQADLMNGTLVITRHPEANHSVSVRRSIEFRDGVVRLAFLLNNPEDTLGLNFRDLEIKKSVHAGHLFSLVMSSKSAKLSDLKTGKMNRKWQELRRAKKLTPEQLALLESKIRQFPLDLQLGQWHHLTMTIQGDTASVILDGSPIGTFSSDGFAHATKREFAISVAKQAIVDELKIYSLPTQSQSE